MTSSSAQRTVGASAAAEGRRPVPEAVLRDGTLSFDGRATAGRFVGETRVVSGHVHGSADLRHARGWVTAPVRSLATGNRRRDRDLNISMESDRYPTLRYDLAGVTTRAVREDGIDAVLHGSLTIHGVTRAVDVPALVHAAGDAITVCGHFPLKLTDYGIGGLTKFFGILRMHEDILVHVALVFRPTGATARG